MLIMLISWINCFEYLFTCPGKRFPLTENYIYRILHANTLKKGKTNILYLKILKKS